MLHKTKAIPSPLIGANKKNRFFHRTDNLIIK